MPAVSTNLKSNGSPRSTKSILLKKRRFSPEHTITSPKSNRMCCEENNNNNSFFATVKQGFTQCNPTLAFDDNARSIEKSKGGKKLSLMEARALSEYGAYLSKERNDHEAAIVTLMRVSESTVEFFHICTHAYSVTFNIALLYCFAGVEKSNVYKWFP